MYDHNFILKYKFSHALIVKLLLFSFGNTKIVSGS